MKEMKFYYFIQIIKLKRTSNGKKNKILLFESKLLDYNEQIGPIIFEIPYDLFK